MGTEYQRTYYEKNKERLREYQREYYYRNKEKILESKKSGRKVEKPKMPKKKESEQKCDIISSKIGQIEMLTKWDEELEEKLTNENLTNFSRWACELNLRENKKTVKELNDESENMFYLGNRNEVIDQLLIFVKKECENTWRTQPQQVVKLKRQFLKQLADKIKSYRT